MQLSLVLSMQSALKFLVVASRPCSLPVIVTVILVSEVTTHDVWGGLRCSFHLSFAYIMHWNSDCFPDGLGSLIRVRFASLATWSRPRAARPEDHIGLNTAFFYPFHSLCTRISKSRRRS